MFFDEFSALYSLFVMFILYCQDGCAASVQVDMQIEAAARLKSTLSDLSALEISRNVSFGPPRPYFPNDFRCGFRKLKEEGVVNRRSGAALVPKSLLVLLL